MKTLLVLAQHPELPETIRSLVAPDHYRVIHRLDVEEAEPLLGGGLVDAVILDVELDNVQGVWAIERIHRRLPRCPILAFTGSRQWEWEEEGYLHGVSYVLTKPARGRLLNALLDRLWPRSTGPATGSPPVPPPRQVHHDYPAPALPPQNPAKELQVLRDFSAVLTHSLKSEAMLRQFLLLLREIVGVNRAAIFLRRPATIFGTVPTMEEGRRIIDLAQDTSAVRYRELYGFTWGDPRHVCRYDAGRGVVFYWWGLLPERRLPLRAYHVVTIWKNGVPIGYFEGLSLLDRVEAGFNLYYTFREGETAWLYSRLLQLFHQAIGATYFWLDPYQIGHDNDEALHSGAFWFYRKLGYKSVDEDLRRLTEAEEKKIASKPGYRTPRTVLRRLARRPMIFGFPGSNLELWSKFDLHRLTMALALGKAPALAKRLRRLEQAKRAPEESAYLLAMRRDKRLCEAMLRIASSPG